MPCLNKNLQKIACLGECMVELSPLTRDTYTRAFAGDTFNTAVYLQRLLENKLFQVSYVTALGTDTLSDHMRAFFRDEHLDCSMVGQVNNKQPGLYSIELDDTGERRFNYWRNDSAARQLLNGGLSESQKQQLVSDFDLIYLSGISLAILDPMSRDCLFNLLNQARLNGAKIAFDSNYRSVLWESAEVARQEINRFLTLVDIALMTFGDERNLYDDGAIKETIVRLQHKAITEIIVKDGAEGCWVVEGINQSFIPAETVCSVMDTTSAGDSFNAAYLASRMNGLDVSKAATHAHHMASLVIQHKGAIIPRHLSADLI